MTQDFRDKEIKQVHPSMVLWLGGMTVIKHTGILAVQIINFVIFFFFCSEKKVLSPYLFGMVHNSSLYFLNQPIFRYMFRKLANTPSLLLLQLNLTELQ